MAGRSSWLRSARCRRPPRPPLWVPSQPGGSAWWDGRRRGVVVSEGEDLDLDTGWVVGASVAETARTWAAQEKQRILDALRAASGRVYGPGGAAHRLGLNPTTLYGKMRKHGISRTG